MRFNPLLPSTQGLRELIAEHKPLIARLKSVSVRLVELSHAQGEAFAEKSKAAEELYGTIKERVRQAACVLEEALPRYTQVTKGRFKPNEISTVPSTEELNAGLLGMYV